jgi:hypothetical protein
MKKLHRKFMTGLGRREWNMYTVNDERPVMFVITLLIILGIVAGRVKRVSFC